MTDKTAVLLDSSVLASFFLSEDVNHLESKLIINRLFRQRHLLTIVLPPLVVYETGFVAIKGGIDEKVVRGRLVRLLSYDEVLILTLSELAVFKHLRRTSRTNQRQPLVRTHDMMILNTAIDFSAIIVTFDRALAVTSRRLSLTTCTLDQEVGSVFPVSNEG